MDTMKNRSVLRNQISIFFKKRPGFARMGFWIIDRLIAIRYGLGSRSDAAPVLSVTAHAAEWVEVNLANGARSKLVRKGEVITNTLPKSTHGFHDWEYKAALTGTVPPASVFEVPGGHVVGAHGAVVSDLGEVLQDLSLPIGDLRGHLWGIRGTLPVPQELEKAWQLAPRRLSGTAAVLTAYMGRGYYHWLYDVLPRLALIRDYGIAIDEIDYFIVPAFTTDYQLQTLASFGISTKKVVATFFTPHVAVDRLIATSVSRPTGFVPRWVCDFLRDAFPPRKPISPTAEKLYVVRSQTDHGLLPDEGTLIERLHSHGFRPISLEDYSLEEKAWILGRAKAILSPSGAGLANIVFCEPGAKVVELRARSRPVMEAWDIANRMDLDFYDVVAERYFRDESQTVALDMGDISPRDVEETLEMAGCLQ